jgi:SAM-dependent methyltransferase
VQTDRVDHEQFRADSRERWEAGAAGWAVRREAFQAAAEPVSRWMVDAIDPRPGEIVLELAAGIGDTGFLAAERIGPDGRLISSDGSEAMVEHARARAAELGLRNVEFKPMEAEWIDLATATIDCVLCRWGYMLLADPETALRETRRVLRPGGRMALAAWDGPEHNTWVTAFGVELVQRGLEPPPDPELPSMFSFARPGRIDELLGAAGFAEWRVDAVDFSFEAPSFDAWWEYQYDLSPVLPRALAPLTPEQRDDVYEAVEQRLSGYAGEDGSLRMPARTLVAVAEA